MDRLTADIIEFIEKLDRMEDSTLINVNRVMKKTYRGLILSKGWKEFLAVSKPIRDKRGELYIEKQYLWALIKHLKPSTYNVLKYFVEP
jgi:hypothetical protein